MKCRGVPMSRERKKGKKHLSLSLSFSLPVSMRRKVGAGREGGESVTRKSRGRKMHCLTNTKGSLSNNTETLGYFEIFIFTLGASR